MANICWFCKWAVESTVWTDAIASRKVLSSVNGENGSAYFSSVAASFYNQSREIIVGLVRRLESNKEPTQELATQKQQVKKKNRMYIYFYMLLALLFAVVHCNKN